MTDGKRDNEEGHALTDLSATAHMRALTDQYAAEHGGGGASCCTAFPLLLTRTWRELTRNKVELALQIFMNMFFSALFGERISVLSTYACHKPRSTERVCVGFVLVQV